MLGVPCLTLRDNTERPATLYQGTNQLVGRDPERIVSAFCRVLRDGVPDRERLPELWDGRAAERIADVLLTPTAPVLRGGLMPMTDAALPTGGVAWRAHA